MVIILIPIVLAVGGYGVLTFMQRPLHKPPFLVRLTVDMRVNGEPANIDRILECRSFAVSPGEFALSFGKRGPTRYAATVGAIGKRLSDGSAVMMWTPYLCAREKNKATAALEPSGFPTGRLPFMAWTPDANSQKSLEIYPSPGYFTKPYARIRDVKFSVESAPSNARPDPPDEFEWFTNQKLNGENRQKFPAMFVGYSRLTLREHEWRGKSQHLDQVLNSIKGVKAFQFVYRTEGNLRKIDMTASQTARAANVVFRTLSGSFALPSQARTNAMHLFRQKQPIYGHDPNIFPLIDVPSVSDNEVVEFDGEKITSQTKNEKSYFKLRHYTYSVFNEIEKNGLLVKNFNLKITPSNSTFYIYDEENKTITRFIFISYSHYPRDGASYYK